MAGVLDTYIRSEMCLFNNKSAIIEIEINDGIKQNINTTDKGRNKPNFNTTEIKEEIKQNMNTTEKDAFTYVHN